MAKHEIRAARRQSKRAIHFRNEGRARKAARASGLAALSYGAAFVGESV